MTWARCTCWRGELAPLRRTRTLIFLAIQYLFPHLIGRLQDAHFVVRLLYLGTLHPPISFLSYATLSLLLISTESKFLQCLLHSLFHLLQDALLEHLFILFSSGLFFFRASPRCSIAFVRALPQLQSLHFVMIF